MTPAEWIQKAEAAIIEAGGETEALAAHRDVDAFGELVYALCTLRASERRVNGWANWLADQEHYNGKVA